MKNTNTMTTTTTPPTKKLNIEIQIKTTQYKLLESKLMHLNEFCAIHKIENNFKILPKKKKRITLLRSPHIHKKTWKTYFIKTMQIKYYISYTVDAPTSNILSRLQTLLKIISPNSNMFINIKF